MQFMMFMASYLIRNKLLGMHALNTLYSYVLLHHIVIS